MHDHPRSPHLGRRVDLSVRQGYHRSMKQALSADRPDFFPIPQKAISYQKKEDQRNQSAKQKTR